MRRLPLLPPVPVPAPGVEHEHEHEHEGGNEAARKALRNPAEAYARLEALYGELDRELAPIAPRCDARGLCCDFDKVDHVLYASRLEVDYVKDHVAPERYAAPSRNRCPLLEDGKCGARAVRMLGCRIYYCAPGWADRASDLYERYYRRIKDIAVELDLDWRYAPALAQLRE